MLLAYTADALVILGVIVSAWYYCFAFLGARLFFRRRDSRTGTEDRSYPGVSVLKPLKGLEPDLFDNLATFFKQDYPKFELIFGVAEAADPAIGVVRELQALYPNVASQVVIDARIYGTNYKVSNLHNMYPASRHEVLVIADSDIRVESDYLRRLTGELATPGVGIVTCLYRARHSGDGPSRMEALFVNADFAPSILVARLVENATYAFGATIALRRSVLQEIGGFLSLANYLADDYFLGNRVAARGYRILLSQTVVETVLSTGSWKNLFEHQLRWARTYRSVRGGSYFALAFTHGLSWAAIGIVLHPTLVWAWLSLAALCALRLGSVWIIANRYLHAPTSLRDLLLLLPKDLLGATVWAGAFLGNDVDWSGARFRVFSDGRMVRTDTPAAADGT